MKQDFFWWLLEWDIPSDLEETFSWKLSDLGLNRYSYELSPKKKNVKRISVWLDSNDWPLKHRLGLVDSLYPLAEAFGISLDAPKWKKIYEEDWSISWKKDWEPDPIGDNLLILPSWLDLPKEYSDRLVIRLDPGSAFGTGSHPTTRLCLEELELNPPSNLKVGDIGCGSGVLGLTSLKLGAKKVFAVDVDPLATNSTMSNCKLNGVSGSSLIVSTGSTEELILLLNDEKLDCITCNIISSVILQLAPSFYKMINPNGFIILSGLLVKEIPLLILTLKKLGWKVVNQKEMDGWGLIVIRLFNS